MKILSAICSLILGFFIFSCSGSSEKTSFVTKLDAVDMFIKTGKVTEAYDLLQDAEKHAYSAYARLGIYKRYMTLGEKNNALKTLQKAFEILPDNNEIRAVYAHHLLRSGENDKALEIAQVLQESRYASLRSEAALKVKQQNIKKMSDYLEEENISVFIGAYESTQDVSWLKNAALIYLSKGDYYSASSLQNSYNFFSDDDALFWAKIQYDAQRYDVCIENLSKVKDSSVLVKSYPLLSDCYYFLGDKEGSHVCRENLVEMARSDSSLGVPSSVLVNSSIYFRSIQKFVEAYDYIMTAANNNPEYVPVLVTYARFAWEDSLPHLMSELELAVRQTNLRTKKMREYDERPKLQIADALDKMNDVLKKQKLAKQDRNDVILVEEAQMYLKLNKSLSPKTRLSYVYNKLEENCLGKNLYPSLLVQFAVHELVAQQEDEVARNLFTNYIDAKYELDSNFNIGLEEEKSDIFGGEGQNVTIEIPESVIKAAFGDRSAQIVKKLEPWECELAAYFTLIDGNASAAQRLYEYAVFETGAKNGNISSQVSVSSVVNLAMIYSSTGNKEKALEVYGLASGKSKIAEEKSNILYRMAYIQYMLGKENEANLSLDYAIALDVSNADARLLKRQIQTAN